MIRDMRREDPEEEWRPFWECGVLLDGRDAAEAVRCALVCPDQLRALSPGQKGGHTWKAASHPRGRLPRVACRYFEIRIT